MRIKKENILTGLLVSEEAWEVNMCYMSYLSEETHSWIQECLRAAGSGSVSYFCRRVEKYVFDYKLQKRKSFLETDLHCRHVARVCRVGRSGRLVGV